MQIGYKKHEEVAARVAEILELHAAIAATTTRPQSAETECLREEIARLRADLKTSQVECERLRVDAERLDWLGQQFVTVRIPLRYGSHECFMGSPNDDDGDRIPWNIRRAIDAAQKGSE